LAISIHYFIFQEIVIIFLRIPGIKSSATAS